MSYEFGELQNHLSSQTCNSRKRGLVKALEQYVEQFREAYAIDTQLVVLNEQQQLDGIIELSVFRIVQETLVNVARHSAAKTCHIRLEFLPSGLNLSVNDDGIGFDVGCS